MLPFIAKTRLFSRWAQSEKIIDAVLFQAGLEIETGLLEARLGHGLVKKRLPAAGRGMRSGYRTILGCRQGDLVIFLYGYAKNERERISPRELEALAELSLQS